MTLTTTGARTPEQIALAQAALAYIEANPQEWNQHDWRCGSGMCYAGHTAVLAGRVFAFDLNEAHHTQRSLLIAEPGEEKAFLANGLPVVHVEDVARRLLGLEAGDSFILFDGDNTLVDLQIYVGRLASGARTLARAGDDE